MDMKVGLTDTITLRLCRRTPAQKTAALAAHRQEAVVVRDLDEEAKGRAAHQRREQQLHPPPRH